MQDFSAFTPWITVGGSIIALFSVVFLIGRWTSKVDTRLDNLSDKIQRGFDEVRTDIKKILERQAPRTTAGAQRPIQLTSLGKKVSASVSTNEWARSQATHLKAESAGKEEFEVFDLCVSHFDRLYADNAGFRRSVRATAYAHGTEAEQIMKVYQVELRDCLLPSSR